MSSGMGKCRGLVVASVRSWCRAAAAMTASGRESWTPLASILIDQAASTVGDSFGHRKVLW